MINHIKWNDNIEKWPAPLPRFNIDPQCTALIVVDMQRYFCAPQEGVGKILKQNFPEMYRFFQNELTQKVIPNSKRLINFFREKHMRIIFITVGPELKDGSDMIERRYLRDKERMEKSGLGNLCYRGSEIHQIIKELEPIEGELVINKNTSNAFNSTAIDVLLRNLRIKTLIFCGIMTNVCVDITARDASDRGYNSLIVEDACSTYEKLTHEMTLRFFARSFGRVTDTVKLIDEIEKSLTEC